MRRVEGPADIDCVAPSVSICLTTALYRCSIVRVPCRWLIEVNASPSLTASSREDYDLKCRLLDDVLNVVDLENR